MDGYSAWHALTGETGPAPKEEVMEPDNRWYTCTTAGCQEETFGEHPRLCNDCVNARTADRRALYREAYMAALGGACADTNVAHPVKDAHALALETVRQWPAMQAELEKEIAG